MRKIVSVFFILSVLFSFSGSVFAQDVPKKEKETVVFNVKMHCGNCEKKIKDNIRFEKGVTKISTNLKENTVSIEFKTAQTSECKLASALEDLGYKPVQKEKKTSCCKH